MFERIENKFKVYYDDKELEPDKVNSLLSDTANRVLIDTLCNLLNDKSQGVKWFVDKDNLYHHPYEQKRSDPYKLYVVKNKEHLKDIHHNGHDEKCFFAYIDNVSNKIIFFDNEGIEKFKTESRSTS